MEYLKFIDEMIKERENLKVKKEFQKVSRRC
jgi:hypothetical protein